LNWLWREVFWGGGGNSDIVLVFIRHLLIFCFLFVKINIKIYKTTVLPVVCMGVKLGLTHRLRVFENTVLRKIFVPKTEEVVR